MTDRNPNVVVTSDEPLAEIVQRLRSAAASGHVVDLVVPIDSALLLTAREFRALKEAVDQDRIAMRLRTSDPLRLQLAERLGIPALALARSRVAVEPAAIAPVPTTPVSEPPGAVDQDWPGTTNVAEPVLRPAPDSQWPSQNGAADEIAEKEDEQEPVAEIDQGSDKANPPRRWLPVAIALGLLVAAAVVGIRYLVPQAVVTIVPQTAPVAASAVFDVTTDGQPIDGNAAFALAPEPRQIEIVWEGSAPVSGVRVEPDGTASSPIELRNASSEPIVVDAGTKIATETGVEFAFAQAVTVPGADPGTGEPGAATGNVQAVEAGSRGNVGTGELGGRLPNGIYYSNRMQPAAGGTDKEFPVVAQVDLDKLAAAATEAAPMLAAKAIADEHPGEGILVSKVSISDQQNEFDHDAGQDADEVSLRSTLKVDVLAYDANDASERYEEILVTRLNDEAPEGFAVASDEIVFDGPTEIEDSDRGVRMEVKAQADATAVLDESERNSLVAELAGAGPEQVDAILKRFPEISNYTVDYRPAWLPKHMPTNGARIQIELETQ